MGKFLEAAYLVLVQEDRPLSAREIVTIAEERGLLASHGKTPWQTMKSKLSTDILRNREVSVFMRGGPGKFALRSWADDMSEYVAARFTKSLLDEDVMVFPASHLRDYVPESGLHARSIDSAALLAECFPMSRRVAEGDYSVVQLVSVFVIRHQDMYLTYKRSRRLPEARLHGTYSVAFGGHLNPGDVTPMFNILEPELGAVALERELVEEVEVHGRSLRYLGLLYDDSVQLSRQHLGIVYEVSISSPKFRIGERGFLTDPKFESLNEMRSRLSDFENWSVFLIRHELGYHPTAGEGVSEDE